MIPTITAFARSPDRGHGLARDFRVRWALEELGRRHAVRLLSFDDLKASEHRRRHPFGQIPTYEEGDLVLFESGAIVLHLAQAHPGLLPPGAQARARAVAWMFAALDSVEPPIWELDMAGILEGDRPWHAERRPLLEARIRQRLDPLASHIGGADWLDGGFSAGDLMMVTVEIGRAHV